ncbi:MAG: hypothetical protein JNM00_07630, partial [Flavobacteriales bacterium]|nr:hypothetical protein [Flavobacteriales bacterium]
PREHDLIIGTFGRAAYILDNIQPLRTYARERDAMLNKRIVAIPSSPATLAAYKQPSGARFAASLEFEGQNKQGGAALTYYYSVEKKEEVTSAKDDKKKGKKTVEEKPAAVAEDKSAKPKKVKVVIMNNAGDTLRWFTHEPDTGINIIHWYFDTEGVRLPSRRESKPDADPPGNGPSVFPGTYKVVYIFGEHRDSTSVEVGYDPRLPHNPEALNAQLALYERWKTAAGKSRKAYELVKQMKKDIEHAKGTWLNVNDSLKKDVVVLSDSLLKQLNELEGLFMSPENQSGITDDSEYLISKFWNATGYLNTGAEMPGSNSETAIRLLEKANDEVVTKVSSFVSEQFTPWRQRAEQVPVQLFKPLEKLE